ncbi:MAG TPA: H-X9-DG-CTERM domain-containing protein, partial [Pirellulales bacterium]|nr:H-X9-DG-CTERM domain-containing protein [Pirellulales bacterium]
DDNGPDAFDVVADDVLACSAVQSAVGGSGGSGSPGEAALARMGMPCHYLGLPNWQQTARSVHPGGVNVCFADGSVRFISDFIDITAQNGTPSVWDRLNLSNDGLPVDASKY